LILTYHGIFILLDDEMEEEEQVYELFDEASDHEMHDVKPDVKPKFISRAEKDNELVVVSGR